MINYILLFVILLGVAGLVVLVLNTWRRKLHLLSIIVFCFGFAVLSTLSWLIMNVSSGSTPPSDDTTAKASQVYIQSTKEQQPAEPQSTSDYSEQNKQQNQEAVERFRQIDVE